MKSRTIECEPDDLRLFLAKTESGAWLPSTAIKLRSGDTTPEVYELLKNEEINPTNVVGDLFGSAPTEMTIRALVEVPTTFVSNKRARLEEFEDVPRIDTKDATYVTLPGRLLEVCGFSSNDDMMLYCRPRVHELWRFLTDEVVGLKSRGVIVGPLVP
ncbi:hypothetical protein PF010_g29308 [Phytophthora fragariae]|nr:hypothetical protein PF009_g29280 [Phytophthora fragariae]KAE8963731.1 hypothetical protein PF011_g28926 [Phytophthora fragariae]KAE9062661.1 hypothetical protein PF010_g29308 [Phytophthora fragariae]